MPYVIDPTTKQRVYVRPPSLAKATGKTSSSVLRGAFVDPKISESEAIQQMAKRAGLEPPTVKDRALNVLRAVGRVVNAGTATVAGAVRGAVRKDISIAQGVAEGLRQNIGFGDVIREDFGVKPVSRLGKLTLGAVGLAADILFDPITYLTFGAGAGLKIGSKTLSKSGTKLFQQIAKESKANRSILNQLFESSASKTGLKETIKTQALKTGISEKTIQRLQKAGSRLFDAGGIKMAGRTMVTAGTLEALPGVRRAISAVKASEKVTKVKDAFGKAFIYDYGRNKKISQMFSKAGIVQRQATEALVRRTETVFKGYSKAEQEQTFSWLYENRVKVLERQKALIEAGTEGARRIAKTEQRANLEKMIEDIPSAKIRDLVRHITLPGGLAESLAKMAKIDIKDAFATYVPALKKKVRDRYLFGFSTPLSNAKFDYTKEFGNRITKEQLETDLFTAFTKQQLNILHDNLRTSTALKVVRQFGVNTTEEAAEKLGLKSFTRKVGRGEKVTTYLPEEIHKQLTEFVDNKKQFGLVDDLAQVTGFDWATGLFKGYVTSLFPSFHLRNLTSNQFQGMLKFGVSAFNPRNWTLGIFGSTGKGLKTKIGTKMGQTLTLGEIVKQAEKEGLFQSTFGRTEQMIEETAKALTKQRSTSRFIVKNLNPLSRENIALQSGRATGQMVENSTRLSYFISEIVSGKSATDAAKSVEDALFNYSKITPFEKSIMRRLIPFWTFSRKNAELQLRTLAKTPGRFGAQFKLFNNVDEVFGEEISPEEFEGIPTWAQEQFGFKSGTDKYGRPNVIYSFGTPVEEFLGRFSGKKSIFLNAVLDTLGKMNPLIKVPAERALKKDFFRDQDLGTIDNAEDFKWMLEAMPESASNELKSLIGWSEKPVGVYVNGIKRGTETRYTADPMKLHILRNMFFSRFVNTGGKLSDETSSGFTKSLQFLSGVKTEAIDTQRQEFFNQLDQSDELKQWAYRVGLIGINEIIYPKEK